MHIDIIDNVQQFNQLKPAWDQIYSADPHATPFVSWAWLRGWIDIVSYGWLVLAIQPDRGMSYVGLLSLASKDNGQNLCIAGTPQSDHTGFVCLPEYEEKAIGTFAAFIQQHLSWDRLQMQDVFDPRLDLFLKHFTHKKFNVRQLESTNCPYIPLPETWDDYLLKSLNQNQRKQLRRCLRKIEGQNQFSVTHVQADNLEHYIEVLLTLWQKYWGTANESTLNIFRALFRRSFQSNQLYLVILWNGEVPVAANVAFVDRHKNAIYVYIGGWDERYASLSPGKTINAYTIRYAIGNGFKIFDFLRGDEPYKYSSFGAIDRFNSNISIERKSFSLRVKKLKRRLRHSLRKRS